MADLYSFTDTRAELRARILRRYKDIQAAEAYERNLLDFVEYVWPVVEPSRPFVRGWMLQAIADHLQAVTDGHIKRLLINVPPGATKSLMTDVFWPAHIWGPSNKPSSRFVCFSYSSHLTERDNDRCRNVVRSERYQRLWGDRVQLSAEQFTKVKFSNLQTGWKLATSVGGVGVGERGDFLIIDDPNDTMDMESESLRNNTKMWFTEVIPDRLNDQKKSAIVVIQQRLHEDDVSGIALSREMGYVHLCAPMYYEPRVYVNGWDGNEIKSMFGPVAEEAVRNKKVFWCDPRTFDGELAWPERFPYEECENLRRDKGPHAWCNPGDAPVLMADFSLKAIEQVAVGDKVVGFQIGTNGRRARHRESTVLSISKSVRPTVKMTLDSGEIIRCTADHRWYTGRNDRTHHPYAPAKVGRRLLRVCPPTIPVLESEEDVRLAGWLAGFFDGEGSAAIHKRREDHSSVLLSFSQGDGRNLPLCHKLEYALDRFGFPWNYRFYTRSDKKSLSAAATHMQRFYWLKTGHEPGKRASRLGLYQRFLHVVQPTKWRDRITASLLNGRMFTGSERVVSIEKHDTEVVYGLETTTGNYVVWGLASSNSSQYQQSPKVRGGNIIKEEYWQTWTEDKFPPMDYIVASLDSAYTEKAVNDPSGLTIWGVFRDKAERPTVTDRSGQPIDLDPSEPGNPKIMLLYAMRNWLSFSDLVKLVIELCCSPNPVFNEHGKPKPRFPVDRLLIEAKASGISVAQELFRLIGDQRMAVELINPAKIGGDKVARVISIENLFSNKLIYKPQRAFADMVVDEMAAFPTGRYDDLTDSTSLALIYLRHKGLLLHATEHSRNVAEKYQYQSTAPLYPGV